ncbi:MAG: Activator of Hsp90 ATPase 1-like protein [Clostridiaceae bacterium]|nr:Activator of Hsp90 ATPase 1-like protein [Clostridiaceae bacterium]
MISFDNIKITVETTVNATIEKVWRYWTEPEHIKKWNNASHDWHTPISENDLRVGGRFLSRMEAKDGSGGFDFSGTYNELKVYETISYSIDDGRKVKINFVDEENKTRIIEVFVIEVFDAEKTNSIDLQKQGWQAILDNFKKYAEQTP